MGLLDRLNKLTEHKERLKHMRGRHDQRDHNRWPAGYVAQTYQPVGRSGRSTSDVVSGTRRQSATNLISNRRGSSNNNLILGNAQSGKRKIPVAVGDALYDAVNDKSTRPNRETLSRFLLEQGLNIIRQQNRAADLKRDKFSVIDPVGVDKKPFWAKGENFFSTMVRTPRILSPEQVGAMPSYWQQAYISAVTALRLKHGSKYQSNVDQHMATAQDFADHMQHLIGKDSPLIDARDMSGIQTLSDVTMPLYDARMTSNQFDLTVGEFSDLRKLMSLPMQLWQKYGPNSSVDNLAEFDALYSTEGMTYMEEGESYQYDVDFGERAGAIIEAMEQGGRAGGKESIFGYVADQFPDMQTHLFNVMQQALRGTSGVNIDSAIVEEIARAAKDGSYTPNEQLFSRPTMTDQNGDQVPYAPVSASLPQQIDENSGDWIIDSVSGAIKPKSSIDLTRAIDSGSRQSMLSAAGGRISINPAALSQRMELIQDLAKETGISPFVISSVLAYWQHGAQTIGSQPVPTLAYLQKAAAELFGLQLGEDDQLSEYQKQQVIMSNDIIENSRQVNAFSSGAEERQNPEVSHYYFDAFQPFVNLGALAEGERYRFTGKMSEKREWSKLDDPTERAKLTPDQIKKMETERAAAREHNKNAGLTAVPITPGAPYENADQARKALLKNVYQRTQELLAKAGIKRATLYRSIGLTQAQLEFIQEQHRDRTGDQLFTLFDSSGKFNPDAIAGIDLNIPRNAMESWTTDFETASSIGANIDEGVSYSQDSKGYWRSKSDPIVAEIVVGGDYDASRMVSTPQTGFGQFREGEVVVTGSRNDQLRVISAHRRSAKKLVKINTNVMSNINSVIQSFLDRVGIDNSAYFYPNAESQDARIQATRIGLIRGKAMALLAAALRKRQRTAQGR